MAEDEQQGHAMPRPTKTTHFEPIFAVPPEENAEGGYDLRFITDPMEHIVVTIPAEVAVALRDGLPAVVLDRSASKIVTPS